MTTPHAATAHVWLAIACLLLPWRSHADLVDDCGALVGAPIQGGLVWGQVEVDHTVMLDGEPVLQTPDGKFILGFGRDAPPSQLLEIRGQHGCTRELHVAAREYSISRVNGVPQRTVTPPPEQLARIARERESVRQAKAKRYQRPDWLIALQRGFDWPARGRISGVYGSQRFYNGTPGSPHYGVDVAVPTGHPVRAPGPGVVTLAEPDLFYSGGTVILDHGYGLSSSFLHMSEVLVKVGDELAQGDLLGKVGATGRATGPHLDWRMSWGAQRIDPQLLVPPMPKTP